MTNIATQLRALQSSADSLLRLIASGQVDPYLKELNHAVIERWRMVDVIKSIEIKVGGRVRVTSDARSRKYRGLTGTVTEKDGKWITVTIPGGLAKYRFVASILEVLS